MYIRCKCILLLQIRIGVYQCTSVGVSTPMFPTCPIPTLELGLGFFNMFGECMFFLLASRWPVLAGS